MEFISVRDFRIRPGEIWEKLKDQDLVITSNGRPIAILSPVEGENIEETFSLLRRLRAQMAVSRIRKETAEAGLDRLSEDEIEAEIRKARDEAGG
jgi:antitoxin (DNA-binding transcriptional repressor) of toxin-antitoxin stability system